MLILPGLGGSGPGHWQTRWQDVHPRYLRIEQRDWDHPRREDWLAALDAALAAADGPVALVAHSLGCALVAHAASRPSATVVAAALLVAPADVDSPVHTPAETRGFAPLPMRPLPFPATVVASADDPFVTLSRARAFADAWGARFVDVGRRGHLNAASGLGDWPEGHRELEELLARAGSPRGRV
ncbi:MAG TPA: alpha/beta fold hydrolase [Polyangia bacterium]